MIKVLTVLLLVLPALGTGCGNSEGYFPPKIILGQDVCDNCFMLINEKKYAAAIILQNGEEKRFDDISCMLSFREANKENVKYYWVYDFLSDNSVDADDAFFVKSKREVTPMGGGIIAFSQRAKAEDFAGKENTSVLKFMDLTNSNN